MANVLPARSRRRNSVSIVGNSWQLLPVTLVDITPLPSVAGNDDFIINTGISWVTLPQDDWRTDAHICALPTFEQEADQFMDENVSSAA